MKKTNLCLTVLLALIIATNTYGSMVPDPFHQGMLDPVSFFVVDDQDSPDPGAVVLTTSSFNLPAGFQVEYLYSGVIDWTALNPLTTFSTPVQGRELVFLRLFNASTSGMDTSGDLTFQGYEAQDLYTTLIIDWGTVNLTISTAGNDDNVAPVPVPGAIWLLGSGILCLIGTRRKAKN